MDALGSTNEGNAVNRLFAAVLVVAACRGAARGQDRFESLPGHDRFKLISDALPELSATGRVTDVEWQEGALLFNRGGERFRFDLVTRELEAAPVPDGAERPREGARGRDGPGRGRQAERAESPDGAWSAVCRDWNVVLEATGGGRTIPVTTEGDRKHRYGTASWVYGEELDQQSAMWWSPDSRLLAYYEFDESLVKDFYLTTGLTTWRTELAIEGYPKAGEPNPVAKLRIYDLKHRRSVPVEIGSDRDGHYIYDVRFSPDGRWLLFNRTNRLQSVLELVAADPKTGASRVVVTETQRSWQDNSPTMRFLTDGERFIWATEKTGLRQYELRHVDGRLLAALSRGPNPVSEIVKVDETAGVAAIFYMAGGGDLPIDSHLYRAGLDGTGPARLTQEPGGHRVWMSPDCQWFVTTCESVTEPPVTALYSVAEGRVATLAEPQTSRFDELSLQPPELFSFIADDGVTPIYGALHKPSRFDPARRYPLVIDVYGGPSSQRVRQRHRPANPYCEFGFLIPVIDSRGTGGRGKSFEESVYMQCGTIDLKDQADGVRFLAARPSVDAARVGIFGHSYGGYMSALAILKHPDVFQVAVASSPVTDWRQYDTIYTERYMRTPQENPAGYDAGSCLTYAGQLRGKLLLMHGMVDDNVHPNNSWQLVDALHKAGRPFSMMFFPNSDHRLGGPTNALRWEFLYDHLIGKD